ncbi:serine/threonine-protein kinase [Microbispora hainanensis]|uniref:serine/threonine-protein kinase n=1 Tax=Microbispora hainanensis TaxID=568844 RepID=UPI001ABF835A|nr:serine/threonine-protein kinase [Microbispora hainanensis]
MDNSVWGVAAIFLSIVISVMDGEGGTMSADGAGTSLGSGYVLLDEIGAGAMGSVWRARHRDTGETVAVKLLREGLGDDQDLVLRFVQERNVMRSLRHPNIVAIRDFVVEGRRLALVMDLVEGRNLRTHLQRRGTLPPAEAAGLLAQVADGVGAAHAEGVVHRDIKPGNILVEENTGRVRLTDFGVARVLHGPGLTQTTSIIGTPTYLAPEVAEGGTPTTAVDVYAIGLILYELLAGRPPYVADHPMVVLRRHATAVPRRLPGMPDALWQIVWACVSKDPAGRPEAAQVAAALRDAAPSLAGLPALPPIAWSDPPSATSETVPPAAPATPDTPAAPAGPPTPAALPPAAPTGEETTASPRGRGSRRRLVAVVTAATALALTASVLAVLSPWRSGASDGAAGTTAREAAEAPATPVSTPSPSAEPSRRRTREAAQRTPEHDPGAAASTPPAKPRPATSPTHRPATQPSPARQTAASPRPRRSEAQATEDGGADEARRPRQSPEWRCRSWISVGDDMGTEMSPCFAMVGDVFYLMGRIRGDASVRSDIHIQLYDSTAEQNVSQPFICSGVSPSGDGATVTCGPFTATAPRTGGEHNVRQRWRKTGTSAFGGGAESPGVVW